MSGTARSSGSGVIALALLLIASSGCKAKPAPTKKTESPKVEAKAVASADASAPLRGRPKPPSALPTTAADIWLANLDAQITELRRLTRTRPDDTTNLLPLSGALYTRGRLHNDPDEIRQALDALDRCIALTPDVANCWLTRAEQEQSLHRFPQARADVANAKALGGDPNRVAALTVDLDYNEGKYSEAIPAIRKERLAHPTTATWIREAQLEHELGHEDLADRAFEAAEDQIHDTGPLVVAHLDLQRGIQKVETGRLDDACVFFRAALERIPGWVAASEHLAETLHMLGKDEEATRLYEEIVKQTKDPEFAHALAELYAAAGKKAEAAALDANARAGYATLLTKYPEAMYWHASEFYLSLGEPAKAAELLRKNAVLRPNSRSFVALAHAELANDKIRDARVAIDRALAMPLVSADLFATAAKIYAKQGDPAAAASFRDRARAINPRITGE